MIDALEVEYLPRIRDSLRPVYLPVMPDVGLEMERLLAPIVVHGEIYGYMWIIADVHALSPIDMMAIEVRRDGGCTSDALSGIAANFRSIAQGQSDRPADRGKRQPTNRIRRSIPALWRRSAPSLANDGTSHQKRLASPGDKPVSQHQPNLDGERRASGSRAIRRRSGNLDTSRASRGRPWQKTLVARLSPTRGPLRLSISTIFQGADSVGAAHQQCNEVLEIAQRIKSRKPVQRFADLGYIHTLFHAGRQSLDHNTHVPVLRKLLEEKQADLFKTLETYLDAGGNSVQTAESLHIHRSTLNYRLARIKEICAVDLSSPGIRVNLQIAIKLMRLFANLPDPDTLN